MSGAAEGDRADAARGSRQNLRASQRTRRTLAFFRSARDRRTGVVLQEWQRDVIGDIGHGTAPGLIDQAASLLARGKLAGAKSFETAACNSCNSASRYSFAMMSALIVLRMFPSHIAIAWSQACSYRLTSKREEASDMRISQ